MNPAHDSPSNPEAFPEDFVAHLASRFGLSPAVAEERLGELLVHYDAVRRQRRQEQEQATHERTRGRAGLLEAWELA